MDADTGQVVTFLLARTLAVGRQIADAAGRPDPIREPAAFRAAQRRTVRIAPLAPTGLQRLRLPWTRTTVLLAA